MKKLLALAAAALFLSSTAYAIDTTNGTYKTIKQAAQKMAKKELFKAPISNSRTWTGVGNYVKSTDFRVIQYNKKQSKTGKVTRVNVGLDHPSQSWGKGQRLTMNVGVMRLNNGRYKGVHLSAKQRNVRYSTKR